MCGVNLADQPDLEEEELAKLTGKKKHLCADWDWMAIDETCPEFEACTCDLGDEQ